MDDALACIAVLYDDFEMDFSTEVRERMKADLRSKRKDKHGRCNPAVDGQRAGGDRFAAVISRFIRYRMKLSLEMPQDFFCIVFHETLFFVQR